MISKFRRILRRSPKRQTDTDQALVDQALVDQALVDQALVDQALVDQALADLEIGTMISYLPELQADVAFQRWLYQESYPEIGRTLGISSATVYQRLHEIQSPEIREALDL